MDDARKTENRLLGEPKLTVLSDAAIVANDPEADRFDLGYQIGPVYDLVRNKKSRTPLSIAFYGDWGTGKTSAMRWLEGRLIEWNDHMPKDYAGDGVKVLPVWFFPWKFQTREDVWRGIIAEIIIACLAIQDDEAGVTEHGRKLLGFFGKGILSLLKASKVSVGPKNFKNTVDLGKTIEGIEAAASETFRPEGKYLNEFVCELQRWVLGIMEKRGRILVLVDDLDRCLPEIALQVLEALKLYLNIEDLIFVVGVDKEVVNQLIAKRYEDLGVEREKSASYLAKMFEVEVDLAPSEPQLARFMTEIERTPGIWQKIESNHREVFRRVLLRMARRSPREIKRLANSAFMAASGTGLTTRDWGPAGPPSPAQAMQVFLVRRILDTRYPGRPLVGGDLGTRFFVEWSRIVRDNQNAAPTVTINDEGLAALRTRASASRRHSGQREPESDENAAIRDIPVHFHALVSDEEFTDLFDLLEHDSN